MVGIETVTWLFYDVAEEQLPELRKETRLGKQGPARKGSLGSTS